MKRTAKSLAIVGVLFATLFRLHSQGYIVPSGVTLHPGNTVHVIQNPTNADYTGFIFRFQGASQFRFYPLLDEGVRTFLVALNDPISLQPISAGIYPELTNPNDYVFNDGVPFYLGFYTGPRWTQFPPTDPIEYADPLFGWAELVNNQGTIELLDSALAYKAQGIYAGTRNLVVPEPGTMGLFGLGALALGWFRWRNSPRRDMKRTAKSLAIVGVLFATLFRLHAQGYLVPNGVITNYGGAALQGEFSVLYNPTKLYYTGFALHPSGLTQPTLATNTFSYDYILDVGVRVFLVSPNDPISLQPIMANNYTEMMFPNRYVFDDGVPFYVGLYTGNQTYYPPNGIYNDPLFGWAELVNNQGTIELLDSALAYKAQGIFAGTRNLVVPEPGTMGLFGLGALALGWRLRRKGT